MPILLANRFFYHLLFRKIQRSFLRGDNWHNISFADNNLGYGLIHYALIRNLKPRRVLCIGSRYGFVPAMCAIACADNGFGKVDFVDAGFNLNEKKDRNNHWGGVGFWKTKSFEDSFEKFGLGKYIRFHIITTKAFSERFPKRKWQYIYVDGDHSYRGVKFDYKKYWPKLTKGGMMLFHDIYTSKLGGLDYGVEKFWKELKKRHSTFEIPGKCGLGIIQK